MQLFDTAEGVARRNGDDLELLDTGGADLHQVVVEGRIEDARIAPAVATVALAAATLLVPLRPKRLIHVGLNYRSHLAEIGQAIPKSPMYALSEVGVALSGPEDTVILPADAPDQVDHECELAIVIGASVEGITADEAWSVVAGVTAMNDLSARDLQIAGLQRGETTAGKLLPGFKPLGPGLLTADEARSGPLPIACSVNGEVRQRATTDEMVFAIPELVAYVSSSVGLVAGDVIMTGSSAGSGFSTGRYLRDGDVVEVMLGDLPPLRTHIGTAPTGSSMVA